MGSCLEKAIMGHGDVFSSLPPPPSPHDRLIITLAMFAKMEHENSTIPGIRMQRGTFTGFFHYSKIATVEEEGDPFSHLVFVQCSHGSRNIFNLDHAVLLD